MTSAENETAPECMPAGPQAPSLEDTSRPKQPVDQIPMGGWHAQGCRPFRHSPLDLSKDEIRLMRNKGRSLGPYYYGYEYTVEHFSRDEAPPYQALSYLWGPEHPSDYIEVNGAGMRVRDNLWEFLQLRAFEGYIWIDQICIDQQNIAERNHQVQQMAEIYRHASHTLVWLNGSADVLSRAATFFWHFDVPTNASETEIGAHGGVSLDYEHRLEREVADVFSSKENKQAVSAFLNHPYWTRMWIVEELLLARSIEIIIGDPSRTSVTVTGQSRSHTCLPFFCVAKFWFLHNEWSSDHHVPEGFPNEETHTHLSAFFSPDFNMQDFSASSFSELITSFSEGRCQDPRDKIYALQGILPPSQRLQVDYSKSVEDVLWEALKAIIDEHHGIYDLYGFDKLEEVTKVMLQLSERMMPRKFLVSKIYLQTSKLATIATEVRATPVDSIERGQQLAKDLLKVFHGLIYGK